MERLPKFALWVGIVVGLFFFSMFVISIVPHMIDQWDRDWERMADPLSENEIKSKLSEMESYKIFYERYPEAREEIEAWDNGGHLKVTAMNFDTNSILSLELRYDTYEECVRQEARCESNPDNERYNVNGAITPDFIANTSCLDEPFLEPNEIEN